MKPLKPLIFKVICILIVFSSAIKISAQINADSLEAALKTANKADQLANLNTLSALYLVKFPGKAIEYGFQAMSIANELRNVPGKIEALINIGNTHLSLGDNKQALSYYMKAFETAKSAGGQKDIARTSLKLGSYYNILSGYEDALKYNLEALKIYKTLDDSTGLSDTYHNIGIVYYYLGALDKAMEYSKNAYEIRAKMKDKIAISKSLNNIAMINMDMKHYAMALDYYFKALKLMEENKTINDQAITMTNIGITYNQMKDNDKAITWYLKSLELFNQFTDNRNKSRLFVCLGISYTELKKYEKAESYLEQGLELAKKLGYIDMIALNYKYLADLYLEIGDFKKTLDFKNLYFDIKDSVFTQAYYKTLIDLQTRIDSDNTQREAALMKEKSALMFLIFIILGLALIIIIVVLYLKYSAKKHANMALNKLNFSNYEANIAIEKLILWSNYQNGTFKFDSKPNDLLGEINKCIMQSKQNIESKKIEITNSASQNMMVWVDSTALNMIIRDLILSAIKITPIGEKVTISSTSKGEFIEVSFAFSALSIKTDEISKLFALNIQQVIADKQNGENLGLSLCKEFVEKSGGSIWVEQTPGKNVEIKFTLPVKS